jgi:nitronate monooxygenase/enoyl-[acyl-carrier protein] reductase II
MEEAMRTRICDLLGIEFPIIQAGMSLFTSAELVCAVSNAGGLGSLGCWRRPVDDFKAQLAKIRAGTKRPFAINHVVPDLYEDVFKLTLEARPAIVSMALADPGDLVRRIHDAGAKAMQQVTTVAQAVQAAEQGVDIIVAQGSDGGGYCGSVGTMALVPQVVDAVKPVPVVAAGGIADGRGIAAAFMLGAEGVNVGTRFLATREAPISDGWKRSILEANAEDAIKVDVLNDIMPNPGSLGYGTVLRSLRSPFIDTWNPRRDEASRQATRLLDQLIAFTKEGRIGDIFPAAGQSAGMVKDIRAAGEVVRSLGEETRAVLKGLEQFFALPAVTADKLL